MQQAAIQPASLGTDTPGCYTTLYDLVSAVREAIGEENDELVTQTVADMMRAGYLKTVRNTAEPAV